MSRSFGELPENSARSLARSRSPALSTEVYSGGGQTDTPILRGAIQTAKWRYSGGGGIFATYVRASHMSVATKNCCLACNSCRINQVAYPCGWCFRVHFLGPSINRSRVLYIRSARVRSARLIPSFLPLLRSTSHAVRPSRQRSCFHFHSVRGAYAPVVTTCLL